MEIILLVCSISVVIICTIESVIIIKREIKSKCNSAKQKR